MPPKRSRSKTGSNGKPIEKYDKFCMNIKCKSSSSSYLIKNKDIIKDFVVKLYQSKKFGEYKMEPDEINIILDTKGKRVCISPVKKLNAIYIKFENIHKKITTDMLKVNDDIILEEPHADILKHHLEVDQKIKVPKGLKWVTLSHNGPYFTWIMEPYEQHNTPVSYNGKMYKLNPKEEEVASFYAKRLITDETAPISHTTNPLFNKNFWKDFKTYLTPEHKKIFTDFSNFNFDKIVNKLKDLKESETESNKRDKQIKNEEKKAEYGYAIVNGVKEKIGAFVIESASIFLGRGKNKISGCIKRNITPEEVTINIGKNDKIPTPPSGYKWKEIVHDQKAEWIAKWTNPITEQPKYIYLSSEGQFKSESDAQKFEKSRKLNKYIDSIRKGYQKAVASSNLEQRQLGTVVYLVDNYGIRIGGPNDDSTADTFGASTLLVEHVKLKMPDKVTFEFLGKDSILYKQTMSLPDIIFKNIQDFIKGKKKDVKIFDKVSACDINNYLKNFDKDISAKVFRTRLGSSIMYDALNNTKIKKNYTEAEKRKAFENANILVANALNHQKSVPKSSEKGIQKLEDELKQLKNELKSKKTKSLETKIEKKQATLDSKNNLKSIAISTSRTNYIDPRLVVSWCKKNELDIKKIYTPVLQRKFKWAIDTTEENWDYEKSPMLTGFEDLEPKELSDECPTKKKTKPDKNKEEEEEEEEEEPLKKKKTKPDKNKDYDEPLKKKDYDDDEDEPLKKIISSSDKSNNKITLLQESYKKLLKKYGYCLVLDEEGSYTVNRVEQTLPVRMKMPTTHKDIYDLSVEMKKNNMEYLALLLIWAVCRDSTKYTTMKKVLKNSGYLEKYKKFVMLI
jgi:DNA topoisomerase IB